MDSNNTQKKELEIDLKDAFQYILYKSWIVILVTIFAIIVSFLYTNVLIEAEYSSDAKIFITNESENNVMSTNDWNLSKQYAVSSAEFVTMDFCQVIANKLNGTNLAPGDKPYDCSKYIGSQSFSDFYAGATGHNAITAKEIFKYISVRSDSNSCTMTVTAVTPNPQLSAIIANSIAESFEDYLAGVLETDEVKAKVLNTGKVADKPSNIKTARNIVVGALVGIILSCGVLFIAFLLDDKIKSPEDVEKYLGLSVLGSIPELEKEI